MNQYADSAQARAGTELRQPIATGAFDWRAAAEYRERDAQAMRLRVRAACDQLARALKC